ncbi:signal peptidase I [bacterium]|nr:signal peptidase I [bacterium]
MNPLKKAFKEWSKDFLKALFFFLILQTYFIQGFVIEGACMEPQLYSNEKILVNKFFLWFKAPQVGDVIVFTFSLDPSKDFIKRVVGVEGDEIEIRDGYLFRNGAKISEPFVKEYIFGNFGPTKIGKNKVCVMGDNRNNSHDSRSWGLVDVSQIKGKAEIKFWPPWAMGFIRSISN